MGFKLARTCAFHMFSPSQHITRLTLNTAKRNCSAGCQMSLQADQKEPIRINYPPVSSNVGKGNPLDMGGSIRKSLISIYFYGPWLPARHVWWHWVSWYHPPHCVGLEAWVPWDPSAQVVRQSCLHLLEQGGNSSNKTDQNWWGQDFSRPTFTPYWEHGRGFFLSNKVGQHFGTGWSATTNVRQLGCVLKEKCWGV